MGRGCIVWWKRNSFSLVYENNQKIFLFYIIAQNWIVPCIIFIIRGNNLVLSIPIILWLCVIKHDMCVCVHARVWEREVEEGGYIWQSTHSGLHSVCIKLKNANETLLKFTNHYAHSANVLETFFLNSDLLNTIQYSLANRGG